MLSPEHLALLRRFLELIFFILAWLAAYFCVALANLRAANPYKPWMYAGLMVLLIWEIRRARAARKRFEEDT